MMSRIASGNQTPGAPRDGSLPDSSRSSWMLLWSARSCAQLLSDPLHGLRDSSAEASRRMSNRPLCERSGAVRLTKVVRAIIHLCEVVTH